MRLLKTFKLNAAMNMAIDEAILHSQTPTLRIYDWKRRSLTFGFSQKIRQAIDLAKCRKLGIEIVRRISGGGTVIHGWDVTFSLIIPRRDRIGDRFFKCLTDGYELISESLIRGFSEIGLSVNQWSEIQNPKPPINICLVNPSRFDLMIDQKKIIGISQRRTANAILFHSYVALDRPPDEMLTAAEISSGLANQTTTINQNCEKKFSREVIENAIIDGFEAVLSRSLSHGKLSDQELKIAQNLAETKYSKDQWNFGNE